MSYAPSTPNHVLLAFWSMLAVAFFGIKSPVKDHLASSWRYPLAHTSNYVFISVLSMYFTGVPTRVSKWLTLWVLSLVVLLFFFQRFGFFLFFLLLAICTDFLEAASFSDCEKSSFFNVIINLRKILMHFWKYRCDAIFQ